MPKVKTAIFGNDLRVELKNYEISKNGNRLSIVPEGAGYFMPEIGPTTFLDWPIRKRFFLFGPTIYKRVYFSIKKGTKYVDFLTGVVYGPDEEQLKKSNLNLLATKIGKDANQGTPWYILSLIHISEP
ncbi:MAG: hypothetical protein JJE15_16690, partial [Desulfobacteraceae bacterium]|nr:hypothetical protein [Desulfobacteraceae bacterium]